jgi:hypothetical protein
MIDEGFGGYRSARNKEESGQYACFFGRAEVQPLPVCPNLDRSENAELQTRPFTPYRARAGGQTADRTPASR